MKELPSNFALLPVEPSDAPELVEVYFAAFQNAHSLFAWPRVPNIRKWWEDMLANECQDPHSHMLKIVELISTDSDVTAGTDAANNTDSHGSKVVAFGKWNHPRPTVEIDRKLPEWPEGSAKELNQTKFGTLIERRIEIMGPLEDHWCMSLLSSSTRSSFFHMIMLCQERKNNKTASINEHRAKSIQFYPLSRVVSQLIIDLDLELIATHPSFQGQGLGSVLMVWGTSRADAEGKECYVESAPKGLALYRKHGFIQRNTTTDFVDVDIPGYGLERD
ncbi:MAG: hypothetical protein Q9157_008197, partial [Trypethelium eluteriae]